MPVVPSCGSPEDTLGAVGSAWSWLGSHLPHLPGASSEASPHLHSIPSCFAPRHGDMASHGASQHHSFVADTAVDSVADAVGVDPAIHVPPAVHHPPSHHASSFNVVTPGGHADARIVDHTGAASNVGIVQVRTSDGWGTVCGANPASADTVCRSMGYDHGSVSGTPCSSYGGQNICGAQGSPVAMSDLKCTGNEWSIEQCKWKLPDEACLDHTKDAVIYCADGSAGDKEGALRLLDGDGAPTVSGQGRLEVFHEGDWGPVCKEEFTAGSAAVACKKMGYSGVDQGATSSCSNINGENVCSSQAPHMKVACNGKEDGFESCPKEVGDDVFCGSKEAVAIKCTGDGNPAGIPSKPAAPTQLSSMAAGVAVSLLMGFLHPGAMAAPGSSVSFI